MKKTVCALCAAIAAAFVLSAASFAYSGSDYTDDGYLAVRIGYVLDGYAQLFRNEDISYPVGSSIGTYPSSPHNVAGITGYECYIYANAVYYYLFGETPYHGSSNYEKSTVPVRGGTINYEVLRENAINCGAYVRTTPSPDGEYSGSSGHSFIILEYDREGIEVLQANNAGPGLISLDRMTWAEFDVMMNRYWGGNVSHIVNPLPSVSTPAEGDAAHSWGEWTVTVSPTCTEDGEETRTCAGCGKTETRTVSARHSWDGGTVTVPATWDEDGVILFVCTACGEERTEPIPRITAPGVFRDVSEEDWFCPYVSYVFRNGLMNGVAPDRFAPSAGTDRAMIVTVLWRAEGSPEPAGESPFSDLEADWYRAAVVWAAEAGIVNGVGEGRFSPTGPLTREQIATILSRYAAFGGEDVSSVSDLSVFPDADAVSEYARDALGWAVGIGLVKGTDAGYAVILDPQGGATRAQVATILSRYYEKTSQ